MDCNWSFMNDGIRCFRPLIGFPPVECQPSNDKKNEYGHPTARTVAGRLRFRFRHRPRPRWRRRRWHWRRRRPRCQFQIPARHLPVYVCGSTVRTTDFHPVRQFGFRLRQLAAMSASYNHFDISFFFSFLLMTTRISFVPHKSYIHSKSPLPVFHF